MIQDFLQTWGYWAVLFGAMVEGESIILSASASAALGHLNILYIMGLTFLGTLFADQAIYVLGVMLGPKTLDYLRNRFPKIAPSINKGLAFLKKNETYYIMSFRFIYGIRIISPFIIGAQGISFKKFAGLNIIAAAIWTVISCALGYFLGAFFGQFTKNITWIVLGVVFLMAGMTTFLAKRNKK